MVSGVAERWGQVVGRLDAILRVVRWTEWYDSKVPYFLLCMTYAMLATGRQGMSALVDLAFLLLSLGCYAAFGHVVNDFADREVDKAAGKWRAIAKWRDSSIVATCLVLASGAIALPMLRFDVPAVLLAAASVLLAGLYSLPPARLKERGALGWAAAALAQRTLPVAVVFQALDAWDLAAVSLTVLSTQIGIRFILVHQLFDRQADLRAGVATPATVGDRRRLGRLLRRIVFPAELATAAVVAVAVGFEAPAFLAASVLCTAGLWYVRGQGYPSAIVSYTLLYELYCIVWPVTLAFVLALRDPLFLAVPVLAIALVAVKSVERLRWLGALRGTALAIRKAEDGRPPPRAAANSDREKPRMADQDMEGARAAAVDARDPFAMAVKGPDPYPALARLREQGAVHRVRWAWLGPSTVIVRHAETLALFRDPRFIKDRDRLAPDAARASGSARRGFRKDMMEVDPPDHTRLRRLISKAFTTSMVAGLERPIRAQADLLISRARSHGEIELIGQYASVIPMMVITRLLGLPIPNFANFQRFTLDLSFSNMAHRNDPRLQAKKERFTQHLLNVFEARRRAPRDDLVSALVQAEQDGDRLSHDELVSMVYLLLLAGYVTTMSLIGAGFYTLLRHPEQLALLQRNPTLIDSAIEELLRFESPLKVTAVTFAREDMEIGGVPIARGTPLRGVIASANRDAVAFPRPDEFDITRAPGPHLAFGQGIHYCVGAPLARMQGRIALLTLLERLPHARLSEQRPPEWLSNPIVRNLRHLPLVI